MSRVFLIVSVLMISLVSCKRDEIIVGNTGYPSDIALVIKKNCVNSGCHNATDKAGELDLSSWKKMFEGSDAGAVVIPYRPDFSTLLYFINTYSDLGPTTTNLMPKNGSALSREDVSKIKNWIAMGAPDSKGNIMFSGNPSRKKYYVINQGCRVVTVFDAETNLPMRYIDIADASEQNTSPHNIKVSPDGQYWYVCFIGGSYIKKYRTTDDSYVGKIYVGNASWNTMSFTPDSKFLFTVDWAPGAGGKVKKCDLNQMIVADSAQLNDAPHGSCVSPDGKFVYITATGGNYVYKINVDSLSKPWTYNQIDFDGMGPQQTIAYNPHEILFSPDGSKYYVTCSGHNNVGDLSLKVFDAALDNLISSVTLPSGAYEMGMSSLTNTMFITSYDATSQYPGGQVMVVNLATNTFMQSIESGVQPHGVAVDDAAGLVYVANRNISNSAPPHHTSVCGGANGNLVYIDLNSLSLLNKQVILSRDPYSVSIRF